MSLFRRRLIASNRKTRLSELVDRTITYVTAEELNGINAIAQYAFAYCEELTSIELPQNINSFGAYSFSNCSNLLNLVVQTSAGWIIINDGAFVNCTKLESITFSSKVTTLRNRLFVGTTRSSKRLTINFLNPNPANIIANSGSNGTFNITILSPSFPYVDVHIPAGREATYRANTAWNDFFNSNRVTVTADL